VDAGHRRRAPEWSKFVTTIRVNEDGLRAVVNAVDSSADEAHSAAVWLSTGGLSQALIGVLSGHGLSAVGLAAQAEELAARTVSQSHLIRGDADLARTWGDNLLGSQVFATSSRDWPAVASGASDWLGDVHSQWKWLGRSLNYLANGSWGTHARRWRTFAYNGSAFSLVGGGALTVAGDLAGGSGGEFVSQTGKFTTAAFEFGTVAKYGSQWTRYLGGKTLLKAAAPLTLAFAAYDAYGLATTGYREALHGDAHGHPPTVRAAIYAAKWVDTLGTVAFAVAPFTGPAAPWLAGGGAALMGLSALVRGTIFASDYLHEHPDLAQQWTSAITSSALHSWAPIRPVRLGLSM
jgi:hypothetical protein